MAWIAPSPQQLSEHSLANVGDSVLKMGGPYSVWPLLHTHTLLLRPGPDNLPRGIMPHQFLLC